MTIATLKKTIPVLVLLLALFIAPAQASRDDVRITSVGWTDVTVTSELAVAILQSLGYSSSNMMTSLPICYQALATNEADVFLGNWMPSMESVARPHFDSGNVIQLVPNMTGAKYTLAVPSYVAAGGLKDFKDIAKYGDKLEWKIYGIEEGNDGNDIIESMIDKNMFGLGKFELVASSESGMLAQVQSFMREKKWIVFLGWSPHSMNEKIDMTYLTGSTDDTFGPNDGTATVYTNVRKGLPQDMPNVTRFLQNYVVPVTMMNSIMVTMHEKPEMKARDAALDWVTAHPDMAATWLESVTTKEGKPGLPAFLKLLESRK
ncbi:ABC transporter substrate-binding protein [Desulfomicrobium baculatum]|uniref:Substrate-binding region of ABC-type glycine betaine transport system n=1 Tax=Desulfomicrobium baculatum (strain DSM 4028 / VKM B-1378 / X) TaxID=525897 RepID=C7LUA1_DESBD|nr:ABC transporter substrate-binding protein [Desulfomicrobium baculatum]ACU90899.1 Substrate-binding region of ABC-type glycine betaine transport system [Desulfomicrobium baculatum DSM 4028]